jgi:hypothetical protein
MKLLAKSDRVTFRMMMEKNKKNMMKSLLKVACKDIKDFTQRTPAHIAVELDDMATAEEAISLGADINAKDSDGITALLLAVRLERRAFVKLLLEKKAYAKGIKSKDWLKVYEREESDIVQLSQDLIGRKSIFFFHARKIRSRSRIGLDSNAI